MMIYSFGSGYTFETHNTTYLNRFKSDIALRKFQNIEVGGYDLICLDRGHGGYGGNVGDHETTILADGSYGLDMTYSKYRATASSASINTQVSQADGDVIKNITMTWVKDVGLSMVETDGPYGGEPCASKSLTSTIWRTACSSDQAFKLSFTLSLERWSVVVNQPDNFSILVDRRHEQVVENQYSLPRWEDKQ